ncbi:XRE family transcriptional regulator [Streptomyces botrytidirepellens]|uniref:XRE family transcriptional regulator n=2 Tax=Streptomyces botrytidirepellens TaxID=2486417 RepID=A0A3M8WD47_9ACTN|nr:XRE family transcriptional regulator [Streptomyces botrytidirepellens]
MQGNSTSTVLGRRLGGELTRLRAAAGLTQTHAAKALTGSTTKVAKMEGGWVPVRDPDIRALCELYGVSDPAVVGGLLELARVDRERRKAKGWWNEFPGVGAMHEYVTLESVATVIRSWQLSFVPGLLQTPEYIRALRQDARTGDSGDDEQFVEARLARQRRLDDTPQLSLRAVMYEAALRNLIGGADVMRAQLDHLVAVAEKGNVSLRVLPFDAGASHGMNCTFNVISFGEPGAMDVVYMEVPFSQLWIEGGEAAAQHDELFERIARRALNEHDSLELISRLSGEL